MTYTNKVELKGFLGAAAAPKTLDGGKTVLNFSVATKMIWGKGDQRQERTEWHRVTWDRIATATPALAKGAYVHVIRRDPQPRITAISRTWPNGLPGLSG